MSRRLCGAMMAVFLLGLCTGCGGSGASGAPSGPAPVVAISAAAGSIQSAGAGTSFASPLSALVTQNGIPVSGEIVTFSAPTSGASGTFANGTATDVELTGVDGLATSTAFTANAKTGGYSVTATVSKAAVTTSFSLTNVPATSFAFYVSGQETSTSSYYVLAGSVVIDAAGNVLSGEQDYNDGAGLTSPEPGGDQITGGSITFPAGAPAGQGTLTLKTNNSSLGLNGDGVEVFGVQFVNFSRALIIQYDGWDTSSGSMDMQTLPSTLSGGFAFAMAGFESSPAPVDFGGLFSVSGSTISNGVIDVNDADNTGIKKNHAFSGVLGAPDPYGRGTLSGISVVGTSVTLRYYIIGPEAIRLIDVDSSDAAIGSAFGQGKATFSNASLENSVFELSGTPYGGIYFAVGQFSTSNTSFSPADFSGYGDDDEPSNGVASSGAVSGTYSIGSNGYGSLKVATTSMELGNFTNLGIYMTDPKLNLEDPNNPVGGGGALVIDMSPGTFGYFVTGASGVIVPQTDTSVTDFKGNYAAGWQNFGSNGCGNEFEMIAQGNMVAGGALHLTGLVSDPFSCLGTPHLTSSGDTFTGTPSPDPNNPGRYTPTQFSSFIDGATGPNFNMVLYQASAGQLFWLDYDSSLTTVAIGPIEQQGSLTGVPATARQQTDGRSIRQSPYHH